jgi:hypothetical protein
MVHTPGSRAAIPVNPTFNNSFTHANMPPIDTCGGPAQFVSLRGQSWSSSLSFGLTIHGALVNVTSAPPLLLSYWYGFPANFGIWAVDNLSIPGGPGGGWAFSFQGSC